MIWSQLAACILPVWQLILQSLNMLGTHLMPPLCFDLRTVNCSRHVTVINHSDFAELSVTVSAYSRHRRYNIISCCVYMKQDVCLSAPKHL